MTAKKSIQISLPSLDIEEWEAIKEPILTGWLTQGPKVSQFEKMFAEKHGVEHALATTSCTTALHLALVALGIGPGDEIIVPAFTWIATANVIEYVGAKPVFCDVSKETYNIDVSQVEKLITEKTKAIIAVHLFGLCADMDPLKELCQKHSLFIIEDAACAAGASYKGETAGALGDIGCFSFHPRKVITTGEGGMCTTNDAQLAEKMNCLRNHGASVSEEQRHHGPKPYILADFNVLGFNYRMTDLQGAVGVVQMEKLDRLISERQMWADWYSKQLQDIPWIIPPKESEEYSHSFQAYVCYIDENISPMSRNDIMEYLQKKGISTRPGTHAVHMLNYYAEKYNFRPEDFPMARDCDQYTIALPLHNKMSVEDYRYVINEIKQIV